MSHQGKRERDEPIWLAPLLERVPACYTPASWEFYLSGVVEQAAERQQLRKRLSSGCMPNYCDGCTPEFRFRMHAQGRCSPWVGKESAG